MVYRSKTSQAYCEFIIRERGPAEHSELTIEVDSSFDAGFVEALKKGLRHNLERAWDPDNKRWYISPFALDRAVDIAKSYFSNVYKTEGEDVVDLHTGALIPTTGNLFS